MQQCKTTRPLYDSLEDSPPSVCSVGQPDEAPTPCESNDALTEKEDSSKDENTDQEEVPLSLDP